MKFILKAEEPVMFGASIYGLTLLDLKLIWWVYLLLFFSPDIGMGGYVVNTCIGAFTYNILHHKGIALIILVAGAIGGNPWTILAGLILFGHASFDRIFGFGLKYSDAFKHTHLGKL